MKYSGNRIFNDNLYTFCFALLCVWLSFGYDHHDELVDSSPVLLVVGLICLGIIIGRSFYFKTTSTQLIAENYLLPFIQFQYNWTEITQVEILDSSRRQFAISGMKIYRTNGRESSTYYTASLMKKDWHGLMMDIKTHHVHIENSSVRLDKIELEDFTV